jgi:hypothetical protein
MIAPADQAPAHWSKPAGTVASGPKTARLNDMICRLQGSMMAGSPALPSAPVRQALQRLIDLVMQLSSPLGGWPADLPYSPAHLAPYITDEVGELLEALDQEQTQDLPGQPQDEPRVTPMAALIPHLLWLLASSNYEVMRLLEGVRSRIYASDVQTRLGVVRLVPVLSLTLGNQCYRLDLVTQSEPDMALGLAAPLSLELVENDLQNQPMEVFQLLDYLERGIGQSKPQLSLLLDPGWSIQALAPFQPWQAGLLQLHLHIAQTEEQTPPTAAANPLPLGTPSGPSLAQDQGLDQGQDPGPTPGFTLDDFAQVLEVNPRGASPAMEGDWLTFTDETWIQAFLNGCAQETMLHHWPRLATLTQQAVAARESACTDLVYAATTGMQVDSPLGKPTFVQGPTPVADVWLRLRWYLAHCSERVMQFMGGLSSRVLVPGRGWQRGYVYLQPVMILTRAGTDPDSPLDPRLWMLDLGSGKRLPTPPPTLPGDAVAAIVDDLAWPNPLTIQSLTIQIEQDIADYAPAIATLGKSVRQCICTSWNRQRPPGRATCP